MVTVAFIGAVEKEMAALGLLLALSGKTSQDVEIITAEEAFNRRYPDPPKYNPVKMMPAMVTPKHFDDRGVIPSKYSTRPKRR